MARRALVGVLLVGLILGLAYQPDVGTAAHYDSAGLVDVVVGTNHAKPLPRIVTVDDLLRVSTPAVLVLVLLAQVCWAAFALTAKDEEGRHRSVFRSPARARRGPPALALG